MHQTRVKPCPPEFPVEFYWYGKEIGKIPQWVELLSTGSDDGSLTSHEAGEEGEMNDGEDKLDNDEEDDEPESDCDNEHSEDNVYQEEAFPSRPCHGPHPLRKHPRPSMKAREVQARD